jgi:uncharacterized protein YyaL (SSP411 family)
MLYDNALLLKTYAEGYKIARREEYREVAGRIVEYLAREMLSPEGGFYAAQDADSEGREGRLLRAGTGRRHPRIGRGTGRAVQPRIRNR